MSKQPTHEVVIRASSYMDEEDVRMEVAYGPLVDDPGDGYVPSCYQLMAKVLNEAMKEAGEPMAFEENDLATERSLN